MTPSASSPAQVPLTGPAPERRRELPPPPTALRTVRNIGIIAHIDSGKTTVSERILHLTGRTHRVGAVDEGTATMDYLPEERERGITITSAATTCRWGATDVTLVDTPGHVDFTAEVERSLRVLDGAVGIFCAVAGVQAQSETVWRQADRYRVPRIAFVNKMDRTGADMDRVVAGIRTRLRARPAVLQIPLGSGPTFRGALDLLSGRPIGPDEGSAPPEPTPAERAAAAAARERLVEAIAETDDALATAWLAGETIPEARLRESLRASTIAGRLSPVLCGSAVRGIGVDAVLDAVRDFLPSPADLPPVEGLDPQGGVPEVRAASDLEPLAALAFKTIADTTGDLTFLRIYSGSLEPGSPVWNPRARKLERVGRLYRMHAARREPLERAGPGTIVAVVGLRESGTGDTLCDPAHPIRLPGAAFPDGVFGVSVAPAAGADRDRFGESLRRLAREDPTLRVRSNGETGETVLEGMGELHLEVALNRIRRDFGVPVVAGRPRVAYRTTLARKLELEIRHIKQTGGHGQFAVIRCRFEPVPGSPEVEFESEVRGGAVPIEYLPSIERGVRDETTRGAGQRYPIVGVRVVLTDGKHHEVDSSDMAFRTAGAMAVREALRLCGTVLLEPRMRLETVAPEEALGEVLGDLAARRADVKEVGHLGDDSLVRAEIPAAETFDYATRLRSLTRGRGVFTLEPLGYAPAPAAVAEKVREADARAAAAGR
ncbi:MAG: elongation factor G [Planctomycetales bacterium]|nr:elongation factor G [Planctomycetales bacterium]